MSEERSANILDLFYPSRNVRERRARRDVEHEHDSLLLSGKREESTATSRKYDFVIALKRSCPAVSHTYDLSASTRRFTSNLHAFPSIVSTFVR